MHPSTRPTFVANPACPPCRERRRNRLAGPMILGVGLLLAAFTGAQAAPRPAATRLATVDRAGVLRWQEDQSEVALFGVNYYPPCHWNYRDLAALGLSHEQVMERDLVHFARLGLDVIRLHVFDREISDAEGNLIDNEHLRLLDFLIAKAKDRGIYTVLTPIAWWPVPGETAGFSNRFTMHQMTTDPAAIPPQTRYLAQFVRHVNPHTGLAYKDDPAVVAFELINEPLYPQGTTDEQVTAYIDALAGAVRSTGNRKPVFYNGWSGRLGALAQAQVDGSSFGWYPTGLVAGHAWKRNALPLVDTYGGPSWNPPMTAPVMNGKARIIYEFDAADIGGSYLYPAMARTFRTGGAQIATQFQYDPLPLAPFNAGWQTHYLNLSYAPGKTLSFAIAAEAFRRLPRLGSFPPHPQGDRFGAFRVSYDEDLSEFVTPKIFLHSNSTKTTPPEIASLERIAGCGSSPVVRYAGTGAYFLDRLSPGVWRIEVHPDAVWVADPFGPDKLGHEVSRTLWRKRRLELALPDLGPGFALDGIDEGNAARMTAQAGAVEVGPGVYLARRAGLTTIPPVDALFGAPVGLREFVAPPAKQQAPAVWMPVPFEAVAGRALSLTAAVATDADPEAVELELSHGAGPAVARLGMSAVGPYRWTANLTGPQMKPGTASLRLVTKVNGAATTFPQEGSWRITVVEPSSPVVLFAYGRDAVRVHGQQPNQVKTVAGMQPGAKAARIAVDRFDPPPACLSFRCEVADQVQHRREDLAGRQYLVVRARAAAPDTKTVEITLTEQDGTPWGANVPLADAWQDIRIPLNSLRYFRHWAGAPAGRGHPGDKPVPGSISAFTVCFGAWQAPTRFDAPHGIELERITIE